MGHEMVRSQARPDFFVHLGVPTGSRRLFTGQSETTGPKGTRKHSLFVAQRLNRIKIRCLPSRINSKYEPFESCGTKSKARPEYRHSRRQGTPDRRNDPRDDRAEKHSER